MLVGGRPQVLWEGLAGLRGDAPSKARGADGERAGRRPRAHQAARPTRQATRRPEHQRHHKQQNSKARAPEGPTMAPEGPEDLAAVPVGGGRARARCWSAAAGPGRASRSTTPSEARVWRSRGRPGPTAPETPAAPHATTCSANGERAARTRGGQVKRPYSPPPGSGRPV